MSARRAMRGGRSWIATGLSRSVRAAGIAVVAAGCGGGAHPHHVRLLITAPTDGATVAVHSLEVVGTVFPPAAIVTVDGRPAMVTAGRFAVPLILAGPVTRVVVAGRDHGYAPAAMSLTVRYARPPRARSAGSAPSGTAATKTPAARKAATGTPAASTATGPIDTGVLAPADRVCSARNRAVLALPVLTPANVASHDAAMASINARAVARLRGLERSPGATSVIGPYVEFLATATADTSRIEGLISAGHAKQAARLTQREFDLALTLNSRAAGLGMPDCGRAALLRVGSGRA